MGTEDSRVEGSTPLSTRALSTMRSPHLWAIAALTILLGLIYYADQFIPFDWRFFTSEYIHDVHRALFLVPMLYAAVVFRTKGAFVMSALSLCVLLPRALLVSPHEDPVLRAIVFIAVASLATVLLAVGQERMQREREALRQLDLARHDLLDSAELLRVSEARYRGLFNSASDAIMVHDLDGNIIEVNESASILTGYSASELTTMSLSQLLTAKSLDVATTGYKALLTDTAAAGRVELELLRKDGVTRIVESAANLISGDSQPVAVQAIARDVTELRRQREGLERYLSEVTKAQEEERKRIARELHDETAQDLATLLLDIEAVTRATDGPPEQTLRRLENLRSRAKAIMQGVRRMSHELRPDVLDHLGLLPALEWLADDIGVSHGIQASIEVLGTPRRLPPDVELLLFRIAQEALSNVRKHSEATNVEVRVEFGPQHVGLAVTDNGKGFALPQTLNDFATAGKLGILGMHERARALGGELFVQSEARQGTTVSVRVAW